MQTAVEAFAVGRTAPVASTSNSTSKLKQGLQSLSQSIEASKPRLPPKPDEEAPLDVQRASGETSEMAEQPSHSSTKTDPQGRLWSTGEGRERWQKRLSGSCTNASLSLAIYSLRVHCAAFGVLIPSAVPAKTKVMLLFEVESFYHAAAFEYEKKPKGKRQRTK